MQIMKGTELEKLGKNTLFFCRGELRLLDAKGTHTSLEGWIKQATTTGEIYPEWRKGLGPGEYKVLEKLEMEALLEQLMLMYRVCYPEPKENHEK